MPEENTNIPQTPAPEKKGHTSLIIGALVLVAAVAVFALTQNAGNRQPAVNQNQSNTSETSNQDNNINDNQQSGQTITYTDNGFSPTEITVPLGTTVIFNNESSRNMWVASGPHPTHTNYPEFDQKAGVGRGESYEFTFTKAGRWPFHNHLFPNHFGAITVTE